MSIYIPMWLVWTLAAVVGFPAVSVVLATVILGSIVRSQIKNGIWK
jgi:hypothetical protein